MTAIRYLIEGSLRYAHGATRFEGDGYREVVLTSDYDALEAQLAESTRHRDQNRETAVALQMRVSALEAALSDIAKQTNLVLHIDMQTSLSARARDALESETAVETRDGTDDPEDCPNCGGIRGTHRGDCPTLKTKDEAARRVLSHPKFAKAQCEVSTNNGDSCSLPAGHPGAHQI